MKRYCIAVTTIALFVLFASSAYPCSTPVFRYAMERWMADYYEGIVIHREEIPDDDPAAVLLQDEQAEFLNLRLSKINLDDEQSWKRLAEEPADSNSTSEPDSAASVFKSRLGIEIPEKLPALVLWYPWHKGRALPFWTGEFAPSAIKALMNSPKRQELARRLTDGQTAVWILVQSGNAAKDKAALQRVNHELETAAGQLKEMAAEFPTEPGTPTFSYEFSTLTISRSDPNEQMLLAMLLKSEPDLDEYATEPVVFPVFGRGRALFALVGEGINSDNLQEAIAFITGPCGCEIKMMNPGVDLLMAANWDASVMKFYEEFYETQQEELPELTSVFPDEPTSDSVPTSATFAQTNAQAQDEQQETEDDSSIVHRPSSIDPAASAPEQGSESVSRGLGVVGTTAVSVGAILAIAALGTFAVTRKHP
ncbi:MAG: hypothetical protein A2Z25_11080 [Planctomycetes bacterium RBG_16_55_9]|nr:MAG: hypothetical protein A2Z25_11080 [Planctomycetes bacterium RBG_16_55_9]